MTVGSGDWLALWDRFVIVNAIADRFSAISEATIDRTATYGQCSFVRIFRKDYRAGSLRNAKSKALRENALKLISEKQP
jgi:hypothetical protein